MRHFRLSTNYRSPSEVFDLAAKIVVADFPDADLPTAVRSTGHQPRLWCRQTPLRSTPTIDTAMINIVRTLLAEVEGHRRRDLPAVNQGRAGGQAGAGPAGGRDRVAVVTPVQAKGLEYDAGCHS